MSPPKSVAALIHSHQPPLPAPRHDALRANAGCPAGAPAWDNHRLGTRSFIYDYDETPPFVPVWNACGGTPGRTPGGKVYTKGVAVSSSKRPPAGNFPAGAAWCAFNFSNFGGDNFTFKACFAWDRAEAEDSGDPSGMRACKGPSSEWPGSPITVWRKLWAFVDSMPGMQPDTSYVPGVFDDGFVEVSVRPGAETQSADFLQWSLHCTDPVLPGEQFPHSAGAVAYAHQVQQLQDRYGANAAQPHPPNPLHSIQVQGVRYLARSRCPQPPNPPDTYRERSRGVACWADGSVDHTAVPVEEILRGNDPRIYACGGNNLSQSCQIYGVPPGSCVSPQELLARAAAHELTHSITYAFDMTSMNCTLDAVADILDYSCLYHSSFGSYLALSRIEFVRKGDGKQ